MPRPYILAEATAEKGAALLAQSCQRIGQFLLELAQVDLRDLYE